MTKLQRLIHEAERSHTADTQRVAAPQGMDALSDRELRAAMFADGFRFESNEERQTRVAKEAQRLRPWSERVHERRTQKALQAWSQVRKTGSWRDQRRWQRRSRRLSPGMVQLLELPDALNRALNKNT